MQPNAKEDSDDEINPLDMHIGLKLRTRRMQLSLTQDKLAKILGLTFQQVQKYEHGANRVSASRLYEMCNALRVPVTYFFEDAPTSRFGFSGMAEAGQELLEGETPLKELDFSSKETADLVRAYYNVDDPKKRKKILDLIRAMTDQD
ncbi:MAG: XRE family transcriptional regulator [Alphaproteobacteria bacterium]|nr:XRE family transcriptional regulator [Alphaproteobacteria bacterium]